MKVERRPALSSITVRSRGAFSRLAIAAEQQLGEAQYAREWRAKLVADDADDLVLHPGDFPHERDVVQQQPECRHRQGHPHQTSAPSVVIAVVISGMVNGWQRRSRRGGP